MKFSISNKSWILLSTAIFISIAFALYFLVYVKGKEGEITSNNFRVLQQVALNINSLEARLMENAEIRSITMSETAETNQKLKPIKEFQKVEADTLFANEKKHILYGIKGIFFKVDTIRNPVDIVVWGGNYYFMDYDVFFDNERFHRKDIFEQVIIIKTNISKDGKVTNRDVLYSNELVGIMDSTFYRKTLRSAKDEITINDDLYISFNQKIHSDNNILISGLVLKFSFEQEKRNVSPISLFTITITLMLIIFALPFLILKVMKRNERLYPRDVSLISLSAIVFPAIFLLFTYTFWIIIGGKVVIKEELDTLSNIIEHNLQKEIDQLMVQMDDLNDYFPYVKDYSKIVGGTAFVLDEMMEDILNQHFSEQFTDNENSNKIQGYKVYRDIINSNLISIKHMKEFFWTTDNAQALIFLSAFSNPGYAINLSHRKYITNIIDDNPSIFKDLSGKNHRIGIESIYSENDGSNEIGIGKATHGSTLPVMAVTAKFSSVMNPILEEGYGFCIVDKKGNVMFHSDRNNNGYENFLNETKGIFTDITKHSGSSFAELNYHGKTQMVLFRPLNCLSDHYIATFVNSELHYSPYTISIISASILLLIFLAVLALVGLSLYYSNLKGIDSTQKVYFINILRPIETEVFYKKYKQLIVVSIGVISYLLLSIYLNGDHYDFIISELFLVVIVLLISSLYLLSNGLHSHNLIHSVIRKPLKNGYSFALAIFLLFSIFRLVLIIVVMPDFFLIFNSLLGLFILVVIVFDVFYGKNLMKLNYVQKSSTKESQVQKSYRLLLVLWIVIYSIIPINLFMQITINKEGEIFSKYRSLNLINRIQAWDKTSEREFRDRFDRGTEGESKYKTFVKSMEKDSINFALVDVHFNHDSIDIYDYRDTYFDIFYSFLRPNYNIRSAASKNYISNISSNTTWVFQSTPIKNVLTQIPKYDNKASFVSVEESKVNFINNHWGFVILLSLITIIILFNILTFTLKKIYGFKFKNYLGRPGSLNSKSIIKIFLSDAYFSNNSTYNNIFIVGVNLGHTTNIKEHFPGKDKEKLITIDFFEIIENLKEENKNLDDYKLENNFNYFIGNSKEIKKNIEALDTPIYVLIEHFEYGYNDIKMNKLKLEVLKHLIDTKKLRCLITSAIYGSKLLEFYNNSIIDLKNLLSSQNIANRIELQERLDDLLIDFEKWKQVLGSFINITFPINKFIQEGDEELSQGEFLDSIKAYLKNTNLNNVSDEELIPAVQRMSHFYYLFIWNSLPKDEQFIVHGLSKYKIVNTDNTIAVNSLLDKGILIYDYSLRIMNESFSNFVLSIENSDEALEKELETRKKSSWNTAIAVIILLFISLLIFLSIGQQGFLSELNSFLAAIVGIIGLLVRFGGFFGAGKTSGLGK